MINKRREVEWKDSFHKLWTYEWTLLPFQGSREKIEKYKEKEKKKKETFMSETICRGNIADPYEYLFGPLLKFWLYFKCPLVEVYLLCYLPSELPSFAYISFSASFLLNLLSLNVLFAFKNITREIGIVDYAK